MNAEHKAKLLKHFRTEDLERYEKFKSTVRETFITSMDMLLFWNIESRIEDMNIKKVQNKRKREDIPLTEMFMEEEPPLSKIKDDFEDYQAVVANNDVFEVIYDVTDKEYYWEPGVSKK